MRTLRALIFRPLVVASLAIGLSSSFACKPDPPDGTNPPDDGDAAAADTDGKKGKKGKKGKDKGGDKDAAAQEDPTKKKCPAENGEASPVFADSVLLYLPKGVEAMVEQNPFYATMNPSQAESVTCIKDVPGAMITFGAMGYFEHDKKKGPEDTAKETVLSIYGEELKVEIKDGKSGGGGDMITYSAVLDIPPDPQNGKPDPAKALLTLKSGYGRMYWQVWECHPAAWNALEASFRRGAEFLLVPDDAGG